MRKWPFDLDRDRGMRITIDLGRLPDCPGRRADIDYALRILSDNGIIEWIECDRDAAMK
jgi:hypothetical protein